MKRILILGMIGVFFTACSEFKLPQLPSVQKTQTQTSKKTLTKEKCEKILKEERETARSFNDFDFMLDVNTCEKMIGQDEAKALSDMIRKGAEK